jgi:hypothetical protein
MLIGSRKNRKHRPHRRAATSRLAPGRARPSTSAGAVGAGRMHGDAQHFERVRHLSVVRDDSLEVIAERLGGGDVNGVQAAEHEGVERRGSSEHFIVEVEERNMGEHSLGSPLRGFPVVPDGAEHLDTRERARNSLGVATEEASQRS